ncbi:hypothetical protein MY3957_001446 [Beauveria namnaoensis]
MYKYPTPAFGAASFAAVEATPTIATVQDIDTQSKVTDTIRGFAFHEGFRMPVKELATKSASNLQTSSLQELGRLAASASPYNNVPERLKTQMMKDLATKSTSVFVLSPDGKYYQEPMAEPGWLSLDKLLLSEQEAQLSKEKYSAQVKALGIRSSDRLIKLLKTASDDCSKYAKIREIFGHGIGKYHPNQLVAKKYMPADGLCEKELLYKFALKISNLQELYRMKKLTMDPYDFYRWAICKNLKSDLLNALSNYRKLLKGIIRTMGDDGRQADQGFRTIVLYWASLTGNERKFGKNKACRVRKLGRPSNPKTGKLASYANHEKVDVKGRELAHEISTSKERARKRRQLADREANRPKIYGGVNAHRAERGISK